MRDVTFGITSFDRPAELLNLIRSIRQRYPLVPINVADNGRRRPPLPDSVRRINLPFDCGLSHARNALIDHLSTKYLLLLEDDFLFSEETSIEPLVEVLETDPEVGVVGGAIRKERRGAQVDPRRGVVRLRQREWQGALGQPKRVDPVAFQQRIG